MNFALLLPSALLALTALVLPLLIHLSRRSEQKPTDFAALRWISAQLRPRRKLVFQEILLLLLRLLLLIALAFFLAKPVSMQSASPKHWVIVLPGANVDMAKDLPSRQTSEWHWLAPGFPDFEGIRMSSDIPLGSLLRELDAQLPANTAITVVVPETLS
ncbi:MAG: BatA domain-containing protein, partial [Methylococcales bacterium]